MSSREGELELGQTRVYAEGQETNRTHHERDLVTATTDFIEPDTSQELWHPSYKAVKGGCSRQGDADPWLALRM